MDVKRLQAGNVVTFEGRPSWWKKLLYWLRILKQPKPKQFIVSWGPARGWDDDGEN